MTWIHSRLTIRGNFEQMSASRHKCSMEKGRRCNFTCHSTNTTVFVEPCCCVRICAGSNWWYHSFCECSLSMVACWVVARSWDSIWHSLDVGCGWMRSVVILFSIIPRMEYMCWLCTRVKRRCLSSIFFFWRTTTTARLWTTIRRRKIRLWESQKHTCLMQKQRTYPRSLKSWSSSDKAHSKRTLTRTTNTATGTALSSSFTLASGGSSAEKSTHSTFRVFIWQMGLSSLPFLQSQAEKTQSLVGGGS